MTQTITTSAASSASLGSINEKGEIYTTTGWSMYGPAWVTEEQIAPTFGYGWKLTGKTAPFQGYTLHELSRTPDTGKDG